jgi:hypothetical protein
MRNIARIMIIPALMLGSTALRAEIGFSCPKPGTIAQFQNGKIEYAGIRNGDPYNCMRIGMKGTKGSFLVNYYAVGNEDYSTVKKAMIELLSKRAPTVTFTYTALSNRNQYQDTWRFLLKETISVGGRSFVADVYERDEQGRLGNSHHSIWTLWFDPRTGIWLKNKVAVVGGQAQGLGGTAGELLSVTEP